MPPSTAHLSGSTSTIVRLTIPCVRSVWKSCIASLRNTHTYSSPSRVRTPTGLDSFLLISPEPAWRRVGTLIVSSLSSFYAFRKQIPRRYGIQTFGQIMPTYKLTYFPIKGLAEQIRFILSYGGVDFVDERVDPENWPALKPSMPFGQVPVLEVDGKALHQSVAIARYLGKQFGIAGKNDLEAQEIDAAAATVDDWRMKIAIWSYEKDAAAKEAKHGPLFNETIPYYLERLDAQVKANGGYLAAGALSWADLAFVASLDYINSMIGSDVIEKYENLKQLKETVLNLPKIKAWVAKRPATER